MKYKNIKFLIYTNGYKRDSSKKEKKTLKSSTLFPLNIFPITRQIKILLENSIKLLKSLKSFINMYKQFRSLFVTVYTEKQKMGKIGSMDRRA